MKLEVYSFHFLINWSLIKKQILLLGIRFSKSRRCTKFSQYCLFRGDEKVLTGFYTMVVYEKTQSSHFRLIAGDWSFSSTFSPGPLICKSIAGKTLDHWLISIFRWVHQCSCNWGHSVCFFLRFTIGGSKEEHRRRQHTFLVSWHHINQVSESISHSNIILTSATLQ